jgi:hypothetical protein
MHNKITRRTLDQQPPVLFIFHTIMIPEAGANAVELHETVFPPKGPYNEFRRRSHE